MSISIAGIVIAFLVLGLLGTAFAILLSVSYRFLSVKGDPKLELFMSILPGSNCGACGYAGCLGLAESLVKGGAEPTGCLAGGAAVAARIAEAMGVSLKPQADTVAFVACRAGRKTAKMKYDYVGVDNCQAASLLFSGDKYCDYGCLGLGTCVQKCPFGAITLDENNLPVIDEDKCTGCGKCLKVCPKEVLALIPKSKKVWIACSSPAKGAEVKKVCQVGCIGCGLCVKVCKPGAITLENNLARIDYQKCTNCGDCVEKCPTEAIASLL